MSSIWGKRIKISVFGESHGSAVGVVIDGFPAGVTVDEEFINRQMQRRAPGLESFSTKRSEPDQPVIQTGVFNGVTTGAPICAMIFNQDTRSRDYAQHQVLPRPGHADYTGSVRFDGFNDYRGGGHFSGRLTAPVVFAGALCKLALKDLGVQIGGHVLQVGSVRDKAFDMANVTREQLEALEKKRFGTIDENVQGEMQELIAKTGKNGDSLGGIIECGAVGLKAGFGTPIFDTVEGNMASFMFSIPAVKGVEFGSGFGASSMTGSQHNDPFVLEGDSVKTTTNNSGGVQGGITNGMPIVFRVAFKPTASIFLPQKTVDLENMTEAELQIRGRHDPCITVRALPVVESGCAIVLLDLLMGGRP